MKDKARWLRTGIFLVGTVVLVLAILFVLGGRDLFVKKIKLCTYFDESVQGLSRGAAVKFKGAPIGTVSDIRIIFPKYVIVEMEIDVSRFTADGGDFETAFVREVREKGLCCRLEYVGITGLKYVDFDYHQNDKKNLDPPRFIGDGPYMYVPSVNSSFADIYKSIAGAVEKINQIDIKGISEEANETLRDLRALLSDPALVSTIRHLNEVSANLESTSGMLGRVLNEERLENLIGELEASLKQLNGFIRHADEAAAQANIPESAAAFRRSADKVADTASALRGASSSLVEGQRELSNTLFKLNQALDSLRMLIEYIESDPGALLRGKIRTDEEK